MFLWELARKTGIKIRELTAFSGNSFPPENKKNAMNTRKTRIQDISQKWRQGDSKTTGMVENPRIYAFS